jgi:hypothetical protein
MKNKFAPFIYSVVAVVLPILVIFELLMRAGYVPLLTNSISFDAKVHYIQKRNVGPTNVMIIGSSITLNNFSSAVIKDSLKTSFFNFSCWGLQINDTRQLIINYLPKYKPKYIIICSSTPDFTTDGNTESITNYLTANNYLKEHFKEYFYIRNYSSLLDIVTRKREMAKHDHGNDDYASLNFDEHGSVLLNISPKNILPERWNEQGGFPTTHTDKQYAELTALSKLLKQRDIKLIFIQSPIRKAYVSTLRSQQVVNSHFKTCKKIIENNGGIYLNLHDTNIFANDTMFVDQFHLSVAGATLFTQLAMHQLKKAVQFN